MEQKLKELIEKKNSIWARMSELAHKEGGLAPEDVEAYRQAEAELDAVIAEEEILRSQMEREAREEQRFEELAEVRTLETGRVVSPGEVQDEEQRTTEVFKRWLVYGMRGLSDEERSIMESRALAVGTGTAGGFTVPEGFVRRLVEARDSFGGLRRAGVTVITTASGNPLPVPTADDTGNVGELLAENTAAAEADSTFGQVVLGAHTFSSKSMRVSRQLLQDTAIDLEGFVARSLGQRIGRAQASYWISGTGTGQPEGILTNITTVTSGTSGTFGYDDLVALEHSLDPSYREAGRYVISDDALRVIRQLTDAQNRPLWAPGMAVGDVAATINGHPYTVDNNMPAVTSGNVPVVFGDLSYYWIRDVADRVMLRLEERYAELLQVAFLAFERSDGKPVTAGDDPYKGLSIAV